MQAEVLTGTDRDALAAVRFGHGMSPHALMPRADRLLDTLRAPDDMAAAWPLIRTPQAMVLAARYFDAWRAERDDPAIGPAAQQSARDALDSARDSTLRVAIQRGLDATAPFRERLVLFWADHFTATARRVGYRALEPAFLEDAIRPFVAGPFPALLRAAVLHPLMLTYLDQTDSFGPNSRVGLRQGRGLNENLARELIELHTLGVDAAYDQRDVTQLAALLTGLWVQPNSERPFRADLAEPGPKTVLGRTYPAQEGIADIHEVLDDLAAHPATAHHLAGKLARHFVSDRPDPDLVDAMTQAWERTGGDLMAVYAAMLDHPQAWTWPGDKVKPPVEFIVSSLRALGVVGADVANLPEKSLKSLVVHPARTMGEVFLQPGGPDGRPEAAEAWITPQGLATRIRWAGVEPRRLLGEVPDPRVLVFTALGPLATPQLIFAAGAAETREQGVALILASPSFNRR